MSEDVRVTPRAADRPRCPYCHDGIDVDGGDWVACRGCLARQHASCWQGRCATCGDDAYLAAGERQTTSSAPRAPNVRRWRERPGELAVGRALREGAALFSHPAYFPILAATLLANVVGGVTLGLASGLFAGQALMVLAALRGEEVRFADLWPTGRVGRLLALGVLNMVVFWGGFVVFVIPGLVLSTLLSYSMTLALDRDRSFGEAIADSYRGVVGSGFFSHLLLSLVTTALVFVCIVPSLVIPFSGTLLLSILWPVIFGSWGSAYRQVFEGETK